MRKLIIAVATLGFIGQADAQISNDAWVQGYRNFQMAPPPAAPRGTWDYQPPPSDPYPYPPINQPYVYTPLPVVPYGGSPRSIITPNGTTTCFGTGALQTCF